MKKIPFLTPAIVAGLLALLGSFYIVQEGQTAIVFNLGRVARADIGPGLHFKIPLIESAQTFDRRLQIMDADSERYLDAERKDLSVDFFALGMIKDVSAYYRATLGSEERMRERLSPIIKDALRNEINSRTLQQVVSGDRAEITRQQLELINEGAQNLGIEIVDLRLKQIELPTDSRVIGDVYDRMRAQRRQVASRLRAEGAERANEIRAEADRESTVIRAEAERDAQALRGEGDAEATRIYGAANSRDPGFYAFQRSLESYRRSFKDGEGVIVLERNDPFLQYLRNDR